MELYVEKELKEKIEPLATQLSERQKEIERLIEQVQTMEGQVSRIDKHYDGVSRAILAKQGVVLKNIDEYHILKEYQRLKEKEIMSKRLLK